MLDLSKSELQVHTNFLQAPQGETEKRKTPQLPKGVRCAFSIVEQLLAEISCNTEAF